MTLDQFINREVATWGEDYIFSLLDRGYEAVELTDNAGQTKWTWVLTKAPIFATMNHGGNPGFLPFPRITRV